MGKTAIEWATDSWNPVTGCDRVSPGCAHCYALDLAARLKRMGQARYQQDGGRSSGPGFGVTLHPDKLGEPLRWRKPRRVFVNSMSDLFHEEIPDEYIAQVFAVMANAPQHTFQVLTKRPERMHAWVGDVAFCEHGWLTHNGDNPTSYGGTGIVIPRGGRLGDGWPLPNVWLGVSIENRRFVHRADLLRETPAAVRFISAEPLLGPLVPHGRSFDDQKWGWYTARHFGSEWNDDPGLDLTGIDWLIAGGESGAKHRPIDLQWVRDLRDACLATPCPRDTNGDGDCSRHCRAMGHHGTAFFFKQWGGRTPKAGGRELDGRTWDEFPHQPSLLEARA